MNGTFLLGACLFLSATASYLLKLGAVAAAGRGWLLLAINPLTLLGAASYAATFFLYALVLQKVPLSLAQPVITAGASVLTVLLSVMFLREMMNWANWTGVLLVCAGVCLLFYGR